MLEIRLRTDDLISYRDAVKLLGVSRMTIYAMIRRGELHPINIAERRFLLKPEVAALARIRAQG